MDKWPSSNESQQRYARPHLEGVWVARRSIDKEGLEHTQLALGPGSYNGRVGFRHFGRFESDWYSGANNSTEAKEWPLEIDIHHPDVVRFSRRLFAGISTTPDDHQFITQLDRRFSSLLPSVPLSKSEHYKRLSDIVREGGGTCAAKTTLLGALLAHKYQKMQVQEIVGHIGVVHDRASSPFMHEWLRIESDTLIFLYDSMYSRTACFARHNNELYKVDGGAGIFHGYSVEATPLQTMRGGLKGAKFLADAKYAEFVY